MIGFPRALVTSYEAVGEQDNEVIANVTIEARIPADATDINVTPYRIFIADELDDLEALFPAFWDIAGYVG